MKKRIVRSTLAIFFSSGLARFIGFVSYMIIARILFPSDFGVMALAWLFVNIFAILFQGFRTSIIQSSEDKSVLFSVIFILEPLLAGLSIVIIFFIAPHVGIFFNSVLLAEILPLLSLVLIITSLAAVPSLKLEKELLFERRIIPSIIGEIVFPLVAIPFALLGYGVLSLVYGTLVANVSNLISVWILAPWKPKLQFSKQILKKVIDKGIKFALVGYLIFLLINVDKGIIGRLLGSEALGFYSLAFMIASVPVEGIAESVGRVALPALSKSEEENIQGIYERFLQLIIMFILPFVVISSVLAWEITFYFYTEKWLPMVRILQILLIYGLFRSIFVSCRDLLNAMGHPEYLIKLNIIQLGVLILLGVPVTQHYGVLGLSCLWTIAMGVIAIYLSCYVRRLLKLNLMYIYRAYIVSAIASVVLVIILKELGFITNIISLIFVIFLGCFVNGVVLIIQRPNLPREYKAFLSTLWK
ncbi:MAG: oligosaccharide flippase family protein [Promethearchaeota archaeon]